jgi:N-acyl-D-aspartate/D-glutamate deacylase
VLGEFVRQRELLGLEEAVRKMTSAPAARLGLADRGLLEDGHFADVVVFDPLTVRSNATYDEPRQYPTGIEHVVVNGTLVVDGGEHTGALPGRVVRR